MGPSFSLFFKLAPARSLSLTMMAYAISQQVTVAFQTVKDDLFIEGSLSLAANRITTSVPRVVFIRNASPSDETDVLLMPCS